MIGYIYKIKNQQTQDIYVGSTLRIDQRWGEHKLLARSGKHHSIIFQRAWDKYGEEAFVFEIIEKCDECSVLELEQHYISMLSPKYNVSPIVGSPPPPPNKPILRVCMVSGDEKVYQTRDEAASDGFNEGEITACCLGRAGSHKGYFWQFVEEEVHHNSWSKTKKVKRIDKYGNETIFNSVVDGVIDGSTSSGISACALGKQKTHNGYRWEYIDEPKCYNKEKRFSGKIKRIEIATGKEFIYEKVSDVKKDGFSQGNVTSCCKGLRGSHKGYRWEYVDNPVEFQSKFKTIIGTHIQTGETRVYSNRASVRQDGFSPQKVGACILGRRLSHKGWAWKELD